MTQIHVKLAEAVALHYWRNEVPYNGAIYQLVKELVENPPGLQSDAATVCRPIYNDLCARVGF